MKLCCCRNSLERTTNHAAPHSLTALLSNVLWRVKIFTVTFTVNVLVLVLKTDLCLMLELSPAVPLTIALWLFDVEMHITGLL